jgi:hypothetical protein
MAQSCCIVLEKSATGHIVVCDHDVAAVSLQTPAARSKPPPPPPPPLAVALVVGRGSWSSLECPTDDPLHQAQQLQQHLGRAPAQRAFFSDCATPIQRQREAALVLAAAAVSASSLVPGGRNDQKIECLQCGCAREHDELGDRTCWCDLCKLHGCLPVRSLAEHATPYLHLDEKGCLVLASGAEHEAVAVRSINGTNLIPACMAACRWCGCLSKRGDRLDLRRVCNACPPDCGAASSEGVAADLLVSASSSTAAASAHVAHQVVHHVSVLEAQVGLRALAAQTVGRAPVQIFLDQQFAGYKFCPEPANVSCVGTAADECAICMDSDTASPQFRLQCGHIFHAACVWSWCASSIGGGGASKKQCPICRAGLATDFAVLEQLKYRRAGIANCSAAPVARLRQPCHGSGSDGPAAAAGLVAGCQVCGCSSEYDDVKDRICFCDTCSEHGCRVSVAPSETAPRLAAELPVPYAGWTAVGRAEFESAGATPLATRISQLCEALRADGSCCTESGGRGRGGSGGPGDGGAVVAAVRVASSCCVERARELAALSSTGYVAATRARLVAAAALPPSMPVAATGRVGSATPPSASVNEEASLSSTLPATESGAPTSPPTIDDSDSARGRGPTAMLSTSSSCLRTTRGSDSPTGGCAPTLASLASAHPSAVPASPVAWVRVKVTLAQGGRLGGGRRCNDVDAADVRRFRLPPGRCSFAEVRKTSIALYNPPAESSITIGFVGAAGDSTVVPIRCEADWMVVWASWAKKSVNVLGTAAESPTASVGSLLPMIRLVLWIG